MAGAFVLSGCADGSPGPGAIAAYGDRNQDWDGDGFSRPEDCNDGDALAFPGADERCNGVDDDCDAEVDEGTTTTYFRDRDADGFGADGKSFDICYAPQGYVAVGGDCDDADPSIGPGADERCDIEGTDEDCDGLINEADPGVVDAWPAWTDGDHDGYGTGAPDLSACFASPDIAALGGDCDDGQAAINPAATEVCDAADTDEDCDGLADDADPDGPDGAIGWYMDADADGYGDPLTGPRWFCDGAPSGYVADAFDCDDTVGVSNPSHYEVCDDGIDNDCDGAPDDCGPLPPVDLETAALVVAGVSNDSRLGATVSSADIDGDGVPALLIGAPRESTPLGVGAGVVHVVPGTARGVYDVPDVEIAALEGAEGGQSFGTRVIGLPDIDADGYGGVASGGFSTGVWIFDGPLAGSISPSAADAALDVGESNEYCGSAYAYGDLDADGILDHMVGCPNSLPERSAAYLVLGPATGAVTASDGALSGGPSDDRFGYSIVRAGDVDGDGADDVAISAPGVVFIVLGPDFVGATGPVDAVASGMLDASDDAGLAMSVGDVDGDGYPDLFAGAPQAGSGAGRVYGVLGPLAADTLTATVRLDGQGTQDQFGASLSSDGDVNGDGVADLLVGAWMEDHNPAGETAGGAYLFYGPMTAGTYVAAVARVRMDGTDGGDLCGSDVALVPDVSGDHRSDVLVGSQKRHSAAGSPITGVQYGGAYLVESEGL